LALFVLIAALTLPSDLKLAERQTLMSALDIEAPSLRCLLYPQKGT
jgi:hypothetical protein